MHIAPKRRAIITKHQGKYIGMFVFAFTNSLGRVSRDCAQDKNAQAAAIRILAHTPRVRGRREFANCFRANAIRKRTIDDRDCSRRTLCCIYIYIYILVDRDATSHRAIIRMCARTTVPIIPILSECLGAKDRHANVGRRDIYRAIRLSGRRV